MKNNDQLIMCKECNTLLIKGVEKCHYCGKDQRNFFIKHKLMSSVGIWLLIFAYYSVANAAQTPMISAASQNLMVREAIALTPAETLELKQTPRQLHKEKIDKLFSFRDGSNYAMMKEIQGAMKDTKSFEHVQTLYQDNRDGTITLSMSYKGRNIFGVVTLHEAYARQEIDTGEILDISYQ